MLYNIVVRNVIVMKCNASTVYPHGTTIIELTGALYNDECIYPSTHLPIYASTHLPIYASTHLLSTAK